MNNFSSPALVGLKKTALVLGGTHDHIHLLGLLKAEGYRTVLVDYHVNPVAAPAADLHVRVSTLDRESVFEIARREHVCLALTSCIDQALSTAAYVSDRLRLPCHLSFDQAVEVTNKTQMKKRLVSGGVPTARYVISVAGCSARVADLAYPLVVKPADSNSSKGIRKVKNESEFAGAAAIAAQESRSGEILIEEFIEGEEFSLDAVVIGGRVHGIMLTELAKAAGRDHFLIVQSLPLYDEHGDKMASACAVAQAITDLFAIKNSPLLVQLIRDGSGVRVVEFGARIGGGSKHHQIRAGTGVDLQKVFLSQVLGGDVLLQGHGSTIPAAMNYVYARPGRLASFRCADALVADGTIDGFYEYKARGMEIGGSLSSADRPCGYLTLAETCEEMKSKIAKADTALGVISDEGKDLMIRGLLRAATGAFN